MIFRLKGKLGEKPTRSRRCKRGVFSIGHWETGKAEKAEMLKSEYLPVLVQNELYER